MRPGNSEVGPRHRDRPTAENTAATQVPAQYAPGPDKTTTRPAVIVRGVVELDLSRHVDRGGCVYDDARATVHRVLSTCPPGVAVRVRLGRAQWVADTVLDMLAECVVDAASVEVVGSDDRGPAHVVPRLRERLEVVQ